MSLESLRILRNILLRAFVIAAGITLLYGVATLLGWRTWSSLVTERWHLIDERTFGILTVAWFSVLRFIVVFGLLVPGLAIHWTLKREAHRGHAH